MNVDQLVEYAAKFGLTAEVGSRVTLDGDRFVIAVQRPPDAGQWSMPSTEIAMAKTIEVAVEQAKIALDRMRPRLEKQLAKLPEPIEDEQRVQLSAGVSTDGVVSMLRVERDGTVRLAAEDIEAIAAAVYRKMRPRKVKITNGP